MNIEQICIASFKSMFDERLEDGVDLTPKYIEMLVKEHCEPYMIVTQGFTHDLLANALDSMDWDYMSYHVNHPVYRETKDACLSRRGYKTMKYYIENNEGLWWSRTDGWCDNTRSLYTQEERDTLNLPMGEGVQWVELTNAT